MSTLSIAELMVDAVVPLPPELTDDAIASLTLHVLREEGADGSWTIGFRFVDDDEMQRMHLDYMGLDSPTDIMTFPTEMDEWAFNGGDADDARGGDIVISVETAAEQASEGAWGLLEELRFLIVHGLLHLLDWDDHAEGDRAAMLDRQRALLRSWETARAVT